MPRLTGDDNAAGSKRSLRESGHDEPPEDAFLATLGKPLKLQTPPAVKATATATTTTTTDCAGSIHD